MNSLELINEKQNLLRALEMNLNWLDFPWLAKSTFQFSISFLMETIPILLTFSLILVLVSFAVLLKFAIWSEVCINFVSGGGENVRESEIYELSSMI